MTIYCFFIIQEKINKEDFPSLEESNIIKNDTGYDVALYAFTRNKDFAHGFKQSRSKKVFKMKKIDISKYEYEKLKKEHEECLILKGYLNTKSIKNNKYVTIQKVMYCTQSEIDIIIYSKEEYISYIISDILDEYFDEFIEKVSFNKKLQNVLNEYFLYDILITMIYPLESIEYDTFIVDEFSLFIKIFKNTL